MHDDRDDNPSWRRSSSALSDKDRNDEYYRGNNSGEYRRDDQRGGGGGTGSGGDYYPRRTPSSGNTSYSGRTSSYVPGSASSRDDYHSSSRLGPVNSGDEMEIDTPAFHDDGDSQRNRPPRDREESDFSRRSTEPPAKRARLNDPGPSSTVPLPVTPAIQPQPMRPQTSLLAPPPAPSTPTPDPRGLAPMMSPGLFQVYTGRPQPISAPMLAAAPPPAAIAAVAVAAPVALSASTAEALAAAREQKQEIVHEMNSKDDEIAKLEKDVEQYRREMEKLGRDLAGLSANVSRASSVLSVSGDSTSSLMRKSVGLQLSESTGSLLAQLALSSRSSESRLQLMRSLGPIFRQGEDLDVTQVILRKNRRTAFAAREGLRERLLGSRTDESQAINTVFDEIPEDPDEYDLQQRVKVLPSGKVAKLFTQPRQLAFFDTNRQAHTRMKTSMLTILRERRKVSVEEEKLLREQYRKQFIRWKRKLRQRRQDEASERMIEALHARGGNPRRFPVRSLRVTQQESELKRRERQEKAKFQVYDDEEERFRRTEAKIPPMEVFDRRRGPVAQIHVVRNNGRLLDPTRLEREYKSAQDWHAEEEAIFIKAYVKYPKDFEKIASFLPDKSVKECIWFYYMSKFRLELKKRTQREGERNHIDLGLKSMEDPNDLTSLIAFGSVVDWSNGASRRGSLRLSEKGPINYAEKGFDQKPLATPEKPRPTPGSPMGKGGFAEDESFRSSSPATGNVDRVSSPVHHQSLSAADSLASPGGDLVATRWSASERDQFKTAWEKYHKDWKAIANFMKTKDVAQVKNFYHNNKKKLHLSDAPSSSASSRSSSLRNPGAGASSAGGTHDAASGSEDENALLDVESDSQDANYGDARVSSPTPPPSSPTRRGGARGGRGGASARGKSASAASAAATPPASPAVPAPSAPTAASSSTDDKDLPSGTPSSHWTEQEKTIFKDQFVKHGKDWKSIADALPSKTANQAKNFYQNYRLKLNLDSLRKQALDAASSAENAVIKAEDENTPPPTPSPAATPIPLLDSLMEIAEQLDSASPPPASRRGGKRTRGRPGKAAGRGGKRPTIKEDFADSLLGPTEAELRTAAAVSLGSGVVLRRELTGSMESLDVNIDDDGVLSRSATPVPPGAAATASAPVAAAALVAPAVAAAPTPTELVAPKPQRLVAPEPTRAVSTRKNNSKKSKVVDDSGSTGSRSRRETPNTSIMDDQEEYFDDEDEEAHGEDDRDQDFDAVGADETPTVAPKESVAARAKRRRKERPSNIAAPVVEEPQQPLPAPVADDAETMEVDVEDVDPLGKPAADGAAEKNSDAMDVDTPNAEPN